MRFQTDLIPATLIRRYKRFLSDIQLGDGQEVTAHCPNPGAMTGLAGPGQGIWVEPNDDPKKKLKFGWRLTELADGHFACVDTAAANRVVGEALSAGLIPEFADYTLHRAEVRYGQNSRADFLLQGGGPDAIVEVKSVTLMREPGLAEFPDTRTERGTKHLRELAEVARSGQRAVLLYLVQRTDCDRVTVAADIDPAYAQAVVAAQQAGVETLAYRARITPAAIDLDAKLTVQKIG